MPKDSRIALPPRPARPEAEEPRAWSWAVSTDDDECCHGLADRTWCDICRLAAPVAIRPGARNGR